MPIRCPYGVIRCHTVSVLRPLPVSVPMSCPPPPSAPVFILYPPCVRIPLRSDTKKHRPETPRNPIETFGGVFVYEKDDKGVSGAIWGVRKVLE